MVNDLRFHYEQEHFTFETCLKHGVNYSSYNIMGGSCVGDANTSKFRVHLSVTFVSVTFFAHKLKGKFLLFFLGHKWNDGL